MLQLVRKVGLQIGDYTATIEPWRVASDPDLDQLIEVLESRGRQLPVIVASGDGRESAPDRPLINVDLLARTTLGIAQVVVVPAEYTYGLTDVFGKMRSVFFGAVRIYAPGFSAASDPYDHTLILGDVVRRDPDSVLRNLRQLAADESLRRTRMGYDVIYFSEVRSIALRIEQEAKVHAGATDAEVLSAAKRHNAALLAGLKEAQDQGQLALEEAVKFEDRARAAETQLFHTRERIRQLEEQLEKRGQAPDSDVILPEGWDDFADWCDQALIGRVVLAPAARKGTKRASFESIVLAAECLIWLAGECRDRRMNGGGSLANIPIGAGVENAPCGADEFRFEFQARYLQADWHIKNGGNTRDPARCLRIYYAWDETTQQIVVADMPAHRRTGAT